MSKCPCGFCHLHVHSEYSLLDGANRVGDIAKRSAEMDMPAAAITDHGVMYGVIDHYEACLKQGIKPIIGCCLAGQLIYTDTGVKPIETIEIGDIVLTHEGRFRPVVRTMTRHYSGPLFGVRAANSNVVWLTDEHPILVSDRTQTRLDWVRADELGARAGRAVQSRRGAKNWKSSAVFPRLRHEKMRLSSRVSLVAALDNEIYEERNGCVFKKKYFNKYDREIQFTIPAELEATPELADFLGLFIAEGSFHRDKLGRATAAMWSFGLERDRALAQRVCKYLQEVLGLKFDWREREDKALLEIICSSTVLARVLESWCGSGAHGKRIPSFIFGWNDVNIRAFLDGLADGDGRINAVNGSVNLKMVARDVVYGARLLLARLGMAGKASPHSHDGHDAYFLSWSPNAAYRRHGTDDKYLHLPIKEVQTRHYDGPVFNIEVQEDNSYVTDIVLHNCEAYVAPRTHRDKDSQLDSQKQTRHLTLWAKNLQGYKNLVKLTTKAHLDGFYYKPRVDHEMLIEHSQGIVCGSACLGGEIPQLIIGQKFEEAVHRAEKYREIFGKENFFLELMDHDLTGQDEVNQRVIDIHHRTGIPLVATNDAHYQRASDERMHKVLVCIGTNSTLDKAALHYGPNFYMKSADEMWDKFKHVPEALENTIRIAEMCDVQLDLKTTHFPNYEVPHGHDLESYFKHLCEERFPSRYPKGHPREAEARTRMAYEQQIIIDKGYPGYFLVVQDFINWSKSRGILVGCRGSAAGCLVSYVLGITNLDPLPYGLLFERFLNPDRTSTPDIDVDFPDKRRDEVLKYVSDKYGKEKVAQIITFGTLAARAAVRDSARAMGLDLKLADNVSKMIPAIPGHAISIAKAIEEVRELGDLYQSDSQVKNLLDTAQQIEGFTRHASRHACGVVIGKEALNELVPLEEKDGDIITQYHAKAVEKVGLVKMDFLGLQNNTVINDTLELIEARHNEKIDLESIALDDKRVYDMLGRGDGVAVFQMEGTGMRKLLRELKPENLEHIIAQISLYRPGPMDEIPRYIQGRFGGKVTYPHPKLEAVLKDTYGMLLYQEQVMQASTVLANFTGGQAESLMKAMSKKKADEMAAMKPLFLDGCKANKISHADATDIFDRMEAFAKYAFNKCIFADSSIRLIDGSEISVAQAFENAPAEIMAMWPDGEIRPHAVARIVQTGRKPLLQIRTQNGREVRATAEHRFLTTQGYLPVSSLCVGDELLTDDEPLKRHPPRGHPGVPSEQQSAFADKPAASTCTAIYESRSEAVHEGGLLMAQPSPACHFNGSYSYMAQWLIAQNIDFEMHKVLPSGRICDFYFAGTYWEMDGMDRVAEYFEAKYGDLPFVVVTPEDFKFRVKHHLQLAHAHNGDPIVSIEPCGEGMTYDIEMAPDGPLNFIANGIVSHNSHAAYYGLVSYWTAWLKTNYKPEFMACKMTSLLEKKDKLLVVIDDCRKNGLQVLAPDVNESNRDFTVVGARNEESIRFGLQAIKGIGEGPVAAICEARKEGGRFINIFDFCTRVAPRTCGKGAIDTLIKCGAFDSIHDNRQAALDAVERAMLSAVAASKGQGDLFGAPSETGQIKSTGTLENVPDASRDERLVWEKELLGLYISDHPLLPLRGFLERRCTALDKIGEEGLRDNARVEIGGIVTSVMKRFDKNSRPWAIFGLEDLVGSIEVLAFAKTYEKCGECVSEDARLIVRGRISADTRRGGFKQSDDEDAESDTVYKIMADEIELIPVEEVADYDDAANVPQVLAAPVEPVSIDEMPPQVLAEPIAPPNGNGISLHRSNLDAPPPSNGNGSYSNGNGAGGNGNYANGNGAPDYAADAQSYAPEFASSTSASNGDWGEAVETIGRFFSPPEWAAGCVHLHVGEDCATAETLGKLWNICKRHHGETEVWLHIDNGLEMMQLRVAPDYWVEPSAEFEQELLGVLRAECLQVSY